MIAKKSEKEIKWNHKIYIIQKKGWKGQKKEQKTNEINGKQQSVRFRPDLINKHIKYKMSKHTQLKSRQTGLEKQKQGYGLPIIISL